MAEMEDLSSSFRRLGQYSWRECVEVIGIPKTVESKDLEHPICKVFNSIGFDIEENK